MHALDPGPVVTDWRRLGEELRRPQAILVISAHWTLDHGAVTAMAAPRTIHDFGGFPRALYQIRYPCPGSPALAQRIIHALQPLSVEADQQWGLDHGAWCLLRYLYPQADIPVLQLALDLSHPPSFHYALGQRLAFLREEGVLLLGSGNIVHNLGKVQWDTDAPPYPWALAFDQWVREKMVDEDIEALCDWDKWSDAGRLSVPTPEHFLPLLTVLGARLPGDVLDFPVTGMEMGAISMTGVRLG